MRRDFFASSLHLMDVVPAGLRAPGAQAAPGALGAVGGDAAAAQAARAALIAAPTIAKGTSD